MYRTDLGQTIFLKSLLLLCIWAWAASPSLSAQVCDSLVFTNPSMEGPGYPTYPEGWFNCFGTSNIQPGLFGCDAEPTDGAGYLGFHSSDAGGEKIHQELAQPLIHTRTYRLIFDVIVEPTPNVPAQWGGGGFGDHTGYVEVYGSIGPCGLDHLLGSTPMLNSSMGWTTIELEFTAVEGYEYLTFVPYDTEGFWTYFAIDNLRNGLYCECIDGPVIEEQIAICEGNSTVINGTEVFDSGLYINNYQSVIGCDSTVMTDLSILPTYDFTDQVQICEGIAYTQGESVYTATGTYIDTYQTIDGCDSTYTTILTAEAQLFYPDTIFICDGQGIELAGEMRYETGAYSMTYQAEAGCDSTVITHLEVLAPSIRQQQVLRCTDEPYSIGGSEYSIDGFYTDTLSSIYGCDSIVNTELIYLRDGALLPNDTTLCMGDQVYIDLSHLEVDLMFWSNDFTPPFISIEDDANDWIDLYWEGCHVSDTITVLFDEPPPADIDTAICDGGRVPILFNRLGGETTWSDGRLEDDFVVSDYEQVTAVVDNICGRFDFSLSVELMECDCPVFAPNAFTPGGDGVNDSFGIDCACDFAKFEFYIFDRFGQILFQTKDPTARWDGTFAKRNIAVANGEYNWVLNYAAITDDDRLIYELLRGGVTLIR